MIRKLWIAALALMLLAAPALAAEPVDEYFERGKEALSLLSYGEYQKAFDRIGFDFSGGTEYTVADFQAFVEENFDALFDGTVQRDVSVCYGSDERWTLAVPVNEPNRPNVETLILTGKDLLSFDGFGMMLWSDVQDALDAAQEVYWNIEYQPARPAIVPDTPS